MLKVIKSKGPDTPIEVKGLGQVRVDKVKSIDGKEVEVEGWLRQLGVVVPVTMRLWKRGLPPVAEEDFWRDYESATTGGGRFPYTVEYIMPRQTEAVYVEDVKKVGEFVALCCHPSSTFAPLKDLLLGRDIYQEAIDNSAVNLEREIETVLKSVRRHLEEAAEAGDPWTFLRYKAKIYSDLASLPGLGGRSCPFCLVHFGECHTCPYGRTHGMCGSYYSDYHLLIKAQEIFSIAIQIYGESDPEKIAALRAEMRQNLTYIFDLLKGKGHE